MGKSSISIALLLLHCVAVSAQFNRSTVYLNVLRKRHCAQPINISAAISDFSQSWANTMARYNLWRHSKTWYGENLAMDYSKSQTDFNKTDPDYYVIRALDMWYGEVKLYNFTKQGWNVRTGHFTQLVWKEVTSVGIGVSFNASNNRVYVVMNFSPGGNANGQYVKNVVPVTACCITAACSPSQRT
jgi:glioma pathogenesis-related protein 2